MSGAKRAPRLFSRGVNAHSQDFRQAGRGWPIVDVWAASATRKARPKFWKHVESAQIPQLRRVAAVPQTMFQKFLVFWAPPHPVAFGGSPELTWPGPPLRVVPGWATPCRASSQDSLRLYRRVPGGSQKRWSCFGGLPGSAGLTHTRPAVGR